MAVGAPYMPMYWGDLLSHEHVMALSLPAFGAWMKTIGAMWKAEEASITRPNIKAWGRSWDCYPDADPEQILLELRTVASVTEHEDGSVTIYSKRVEEELEKLFDKREKRRKRKERFDEKHRGDDDSEDEEDDSPEVTRSERVQNGIGTDTPHVRGTRPLTSDSDSKNVREEELEKEASPDYDAAMESWNEFSDDVGLPSIRKMTRKRRAGVRAKWDEVWPHIEDIYQEIRGSPFLLGQEGRDSWGGVTFDFIWVREDNYTRILEGAYSNGKANTHRRSGESGRPVHGVGEDEAGASGEMQGGVPESIRRSIAKKRDGELTNLEYLVKCGYSYDAARRLASGDGIDRPRLSPGDEGDGAGDRPEGNPDWPDDGALSEHGPAEAHSRSTGTG